MAKKQLTIARFSTKSKYKAIANAIVELLWLKYRLLECGYTCFMKATLCCDKFGTIYLSSNNVFYARTKHIELDYHLFVNRLQKEFSRSNSSPQMIKLLIYLPSCCIVFDLLLFMTNFV